MVSYYLLGFSLVMLEAITGGRVGLSTLVLLAAFRKAPTQAYWLAFWGGVFSDLVFGRTIGTTAFYLLLAAASVVLFKMRVKPGYLGVVGVIVFWGVITWFVWA